MFNGYKYATINQPTNWSHLVINEKMPFDLIGTLKTSTWNLFTATLINTLEKDEGHKKLRGKKDVSIEDKNSLISDIPKKYYKWLHLFSKNAVTLPQHQLWDYKIKLEPGK